MSDQDIQSILQEDREFPPADSFVGNARINPQRYQELCDQAEADPQEFWANLAREHLHWHKPFKVVLDDSDAPNFRWFCDGKLNVSHNCLDVHLAEHGDKIAIIFEGEPGDIRRLSYRDLHAEVCRFSNGLK